MPVKQTWLIWANDNEFPEIIELIIWPWQNKAQQNDVCITRSSSPQNAIHRVISGRNIQTSVDYVYNHVHEVWRCNVLFASQLHYPKQFGLNNVCWLYRYLSPPVGNNWWSYSGCGDNWIWKAHCTQSTSAGHTNLIFIPFWYIKFDRFF